MPEKSVPTAEQQSSGDRAPRLAATRRSFKLGIGGRLVLGLAAVAAVILVGHSIATETTRKAASAVRSMQSEHEPLAPPREIWARWDAEGDLLIAPEGYARAQVRAQYDSRGVA